MDLHSSNDKPTGATASALPQIADCGASNEHAPVILMDGGGNDDRSTVELIQRLESGGVIVLGAGNSDGLNAGSLRDAHATDMPRSRRQSPAMQALMVATALIGGMAIPVGMLSPTRMRSSPPIALTQQDIDRLAAAQAKRDRRHAKRVGAQP